MPQILYYSGLVRYYKHIHVVYSYSVVCKDIETGPCIA